MNKELAKLLNLINYLLINLRYMLNAINGEMFVKGNQCDLFHYSVEEF